MAKKKFAVPPLTWEKINSYSNRWQLYKDLIGGIPEDLTVTDACLGAHWCYVESEAGLGMSMLVRGGSGTFGLTLQAENMNLRTLACYATSWNFMEASLGVAALNSWYSSPEVATKAGMLYEDRPENDGFKLYERLIADKKVTVVGHFPLIERLADTCQLAILEREPSGTDVPDPGCEYIIPEQDFLFVTGITLTNKTMPRLLELAQMGNCQTILVGPSVVPAPILFDHGVCCLAGSTCLPQNHDQIKLAIRQNATDGIFKQGVQKMRIERPGWPA